MILPRLDVLAPPVLARRAEIPVGMVFMHHGRPLRVFRVHGTDAAAPVIVEELVDSEVGLHGQLSLWSVAGVAQAMARPHSP